MKLKALRKEKEERLSRSRRHAWTTGQNATTAQLGKGKTTTLKLFITIEATQAAAPTHATPALASIKMVAPALTQVIVNLRMILLFEKTAPSMQLLGR